MTTKCIATVNTGRPCMNNTCYENLCGIHNKIYKVVTLTIYNPVGLNLLELLSFNKYFKMKYEITKSYNQYEMSEIINFLKEDLYVYNIFKKMNRYEKQLLVKSSTNNFEYKFDT